MSEQTRRGFRLMCNASALTLFLVLGLSSPSSLAQSFVCHPIRRGESAGQAARRIAGDSRHMYLASFQIMNGSSRFIPKSQYNRVLAGWRACVVSLPARTAPNGRRLDPPAVVAVAESVTGADHGQHGGDAPNAVSASSAPLSPRRTANVDLTLVWLGAAIAVPWFGLQIVDGYLTRRKTASVLVRLFANRFITEFERPLVRFDETEGPLRARVRGRRRGRFDILLAPGSGRRYPNLTDHKRNVEYDVGRVLRALDDDAFVSGTPYTQAGWVVVPFQPNSGPQQPGIRCISSF